FLLESRPGREQEDGHGSIRCHGSLPEELPIPVRPVDFGVALQALAEDRARILAVDVLEIHVARVTQGARIVIREQARVRGSVRLVAREALEAPVALVFEEEGSGLLQ